MADLDLNTVLAESQLYNALYGEIGQEEQASATAAALNLSSKGAAAEAGQYAIAGQLSTQNANLALVSGQIQQFQTMRQLTKTIGAQQAGVAGAGFQGSGSAISLARSSLQQGLLQSQVEGVNADLSASGYYQQAASSNAQVTAANTASSVAAANAAAATNVANLSMQAATNTKNFLAQIPGAPGSATGPPQYGANPLVTYTPGSLYAAPTSLYNPPSLSKSAVPGLPEIPPVVNPTQPASTPLVNLNPFAPGH